MNHTNNYSTVTYNPPKKHCRHFRIAGITVNVEWDFPAETIHFARNLEPFSVCSPGEDNVTLSHRLTIPSIDEKTLGKELYRQLPWAIFEKDGVWCYKGIFPPGLDDAPHRLAFFHNSHTEATIYSPDSQVKRILTEGFHSLSLFPTDQIWLTHLLADRNALLLHSAAAVINGCGVLFVGHSGAGKTTMVGLLKVAHEQQNLDVEILCDDRNIVRRWTDGWRVHGTWSHGDIADVSPRHAPLKAIYFLEQANENRIFPLCDQKSLLQRLLVTNIRAILTADLVKKNLDTLEKLLVEARFFRMRFDKTGDILQNLAKELA